MIHVRIQWRAYLFHFLVFYGLSLVHTQLLPFLTLIGYHGIQKGILLAGSAIVTIIGQIIMGHISDTNHHNKRWFCLGYLLLLVSAFLLYNYMQKVFVYQLLFVGLSGGMVKVMMGFDETWMLADEERQYGLLRAAGSLGFTVGAITSSFLIIDSSYTLLLWGLVVVGILFLWSIKYQYVALHSDDFGKSNMKWYTFFQNKSYLILVVTLCFIYLIGSADQYVVIDKMLALQASKNQIGLKWAVQAIMEIPLLLYSTKLLNKIRAEYLLGIGIFMFGVKFFLYGFVSTSRLIILVASLQIVTLPLIMVSSKILIQQLYQKEGFASAQMVAMAIFIGISMLVSPLLSSFLTTQFGINMTLYILAGIMIIPFLLLFVFQRLQNKIVYKK